MQTRASAMATIAFPTFTDLGVVAEGAGPRAFADAWASSAATNAGQVTTLLFASVAPTGRAPTLRLVFANAKNLAAIKLLQDWIEEDQGALPPTLADEMRDLQASRFRLPERW